MKKSSRGLQIKVATSLAILIFVVVGGIVYLNISNQIVQMRAEVQRSGNDLANMVYNGMISPISTGDAKVVDQQMAEIKKKMEDIAVFIFDFNKDIVFSSEMEKKGTNLAKQIESAQLLDSLDRLVRDGDSPETAHEEVIEGMPYLTVLRPILNEKRCYHCHGSSSKVIGGLMVRQNVKETNDRLIALRNKNIVIGLSGIVITILTICLLISRLVIRPVNHIVESLTEGADQVTVAANQVSSASQQLAEGSGEQAASLEETSSSLEEMSSMTKQNAENADLANGLMKQSHQVVTQANNSMIKLITSMEEITSASEETSKIIKTIDEIAFQTNLLALNAAVEAARAGEAGAGFAVVANEVRNLALRAAEAAKNTAGMIETTVEKIKDGSELINKTAEAFTEVATSSNKVDGLIDQISTATNEQAQGIEQVNKAVIEMEKVVQQSAANSEENASTSEELNAQAEQMRGVVNGLATLIKGTRKSNINK